jgi:hypothetical protein
VRSTPVQLSRLSIRRVHTRSDFRFYSPARAPCTRKRARSPLTVAWPSLSRVIRYLNVCNNHYDDKPSSEGRRTVTIRVGSRSNVPHSPFAHDPIPFRFLTFRSLYSPKTGRFYIFTASIRYTRVLQSTMFQIRGFNLQVYE